MAKPRSQVGRNNPESELSPEREREIDDMFAMDAAAAPQIDPETGAALPPVSPIFASAQGGGRLEFPPMPELQRGFQEIVRNLFEDGLDVVAEYRDIQDSLSIKGALTPVAVQSAANNVEAMADRAYRVYLIALNEYEAYMREIGVIEAALRDAATAQLEREKASKIRTKQITEADISATIAQSYPDEWDDVQRRKGQAKGMLDYLQNLAALAKSRCFSVSKMQRD